MLAKLFLAFTLIPLAELYLLVTIGTHIGVGPTIAIVLGTGIAGAWLAKQQGLATLGRIQASLGQGIMPAEELLDGALLLVGGVLLVTPGLLTDLAGLSLLIPPTRTALKRWLRRRFQTLISHGRVVTRTIDIE